MKKWLSVLLALTLPLGCLLPAAAEQKVDLTGKLVIVHTNDVHGAITGYANALNSQIGYPRTVMGTLVVGF